MLTPELRITIANSDALADVAKIGKSTGADLARNLKAAGFAKPGEIFQAHHDLPQKFREWFVGHGIDIDKAQYGRWVQGGWHQEFTPAFQQAWQKFIDAEPKTCYTVAEIEQQMNKLKNNLRFASYPPPVTN